MKAGLNNSILMNEVEVMVHNFEYEVMKYTTASCLLIPLQNLCSEGNQVHRHEDTQKQPVEMPT